MIQKLYNLILFTLMIGLLLVLGSVVFMVLNRVEFIIFESFNFLSLTTIIFSTGCGLLMFSYGMAVGVYIGKKHG